MKIGFINIPLREDFSIKSLMGFEKNLANMLLFFSVAAMLIMLVIGITTYLGHGHHAYNVTREHPWGLMIAVYIFFVVSSTGLCIVGSLGDVFGFKDYMMISKRAIFGL